MTDAEHIKAEADIAATKRAIARLDSRIAHLQSELPKVLAAEEAATKAAAEEALRRRAEDCRKANTVESKKLLTDFDWLASQMGDVLSRLREIADETNNVNAALRENWVADSVVSYDSLYRKHSAGHYEFRVPRWCCHLPFPAARLIGLGHKRPAHPVEIGGEPRAVLVI